MLGGGFGSEKVNVAKTIRFLPCAHLGSHTFAPGVDKSGFQQLDRAIKQMPVSVNPHDPSPVDLMESLQEDTSRPWVKMTGPHKTNPVKTGNIILNTQQVLNIRTMSMRIYRIPGHIWAGATWPAGLATPPCCSTSWMTSWKTGASQHAHPPM